MNPKQLKVVRQAKLDEMFSRLGRDEPLNDDERTALLWLIFDESLLQRGIQALQRETRGTGAMESSMERVLGIIGHHRLIADGGTTVEEDTVIAYEMQLPIPTVDEKIEA